MLKNLKYAFVIAMLFFAGANAATLVVLEITASNDEMDLSIEETRFLSDDLRRQAMRLLPSDYTVLTRDNIISLAPENTENLKSVTDIGIALKSDYVTRNFIGKLGSLFTLTVELYETASGDLLGDFVKESSDLKGLLDAIRENSPELFAKIKQREERNQALAIPANSTNIPTNIPDEPKKTKTSFWVALGLDVLGATALGLGIYNNAKAGDYYRESKNLLEDMPGELGPFRDRKDEFDSKYKKAQNAKTARNIFHATGSILLLGGIAVHIWF